MKTTKYNLISILSLVGIVVSSYLVYKYYTPKIACSSCSIVNTSSYSEVLGMPVALIGVLGFLVIFILSLIKKMKPIFLLSLVSVAFIIYFVSIELLVLGELCYLCTITHITGLSIFMLSYDRRYIPNVQISS